MTMNLSGSLGAFGVDEVLSLLGMGGRTARMHVTSARGVGSVHLVDGHVSAASADVTRLGLLRQLVAADAVPAADLARALEHPEPVAALVESGAVSRDVAHRVAVDSIVDALGEMLAWGEGEFAVWAGEADPADIGVRLPIGEALERGRSRRDEWGRVRESLPESGTVLALAAHVVESPSIDATDWSVLARVDGRRTLAEVVAAAGIAPLVASDRLVQLMGRGLVRVRAEEAAEVDAAGEMIAAFEGGAAAVDVEEPAEVVRVLVEAEDVGASDLLVVEDVAVEDAVASDLLVVEDVAVEDVAVAPDLLMDDEVPATEDQQREPVVVPVLLEDPVVVAAPWGLAPEPVPATDPAVEAWLESATPADELVALVGQVPDVPVMGNAWSDAGEPAEPVVEAVEVLGGQGPADSLVEASAPEMVGFAPDPEPVFSFPVEVEPAAWAPQMVDPVEAPAVAGAPVAHGVEWSPWAQALGLGAPAPEGELIVDPLAGPGIAEMIADAHGLAETSHVPVPQVPVAPMAEPVVEPLAGPTVEPVAGPMAGPMAEWVPVPGPREPQGQTWSAAEVEVEAEVDPALEAPMEPEAAVAVAPPAASSDPLTGGLLSQLMSGVRGL